MVKLIMGLKGSGKTKQLIELVNKAVDEESGAIVFIEKGAKLTHDIPHSVRLVESTPYGFDGYDFLKGFISGLHAANYDTTHIFIDSALKIIGAEPDERIGGFLEWCEGFSDRENVKFTITISADISLATDKMKKYF
jgi:hypothetical protein